MDDDLFSVKGKVVIITGRWTKELVNFLHWVFQKDGATVYCIEKKFKKDQKSRRGLNKICFAI